MARREVPEINSSSMADIAFMLLIFFLVATTMDFDEGLNRMLPPIVDKPIDDPNIEIRERNIFVVLVNKDDLLLVEGRPMDVSQVLQATKEFILNPTRAENLPEFVSTSIPLLGKRDVSKGVVSLQNDRGTSYGMYIEVQNELVRAYNEVRNLAAKEEFGKDFDDLEEDQMEAIRKLIPQRISEAEPKRIGGN